MTKKKPTLNSVLIIYSAAYLLKDILAELTPALTKFGDDAISP